MVESNLDPHDLQRFSRGDHCRAWQFMGAHLRTLNRRRGVHFSVWAPNADGVSVIGDFNDWDGNRHPMQVRGESGIWEIFVPGLNSGALYKFQLCNRERGEVIDKIDPFARQFECRPNTACMVEGPVGHHWQDDDWRHKRPDWHRAPMSIYELHAGSWRRNPDGSFYGYRKLADALVEELARSGFTHVELMPITEHPLDASWGYQAIGYFAPTSRFGGTDDFRYFVDTLHRSNIGVILDWVPAHFPKDEHALVRFDGTALFEHADPRQGETAEWDTMAFNFGRHEVRSFLISSALFWLEHFHLDGLRIDAVAAMIYLDYGRKDGEWVPNIHGGRENLEAVAFLQQLNTVTHRECPGTVTIAEESTAWPGISRPVHLGGLGFSMKWNMGWMHDSLDYLRHDPIFRRFHHDRLTFGLLYAFSENFVLPFSHDEVVHGKGSLLSKMPGDRWQQFANVRLLYAYFFAYPGKKLLFMGDELGEHREWSHDGTLDYDLLQQPLNRGLYRLVSDLNRYYRDLGALHTGDFDSASFEWIDCHDADQSIISFLRREAHASVRENASMLVAVFNFTPIPRYGYRIGVPRGGTWHECLNSDSTHYGGSGVGNQGRAVARQTAWMGRSYSMDITVPPLAAVWFLPEDDL